MSKSNGIGGEMGGLIKIETITPAMARALLSRDSKNRPVRPGVVKRYAAEMAARNWQLNGETIKISTNGSVLDGQHRLEACIAANTPFMTVMVYDLPTEVFRTIDNGTPRSLADLLNLRGVPYATIIAAAAPYVMYWDRVELSDKIRTDRPGLYKTPTRNEKFAWLEASSFDIWNDSAKMARRARGLCTPSIACASHYIMARTSRAKADSFFEKFVTGTGLDSEKDPVLQLRSRLIKDNSKKIPALPMERFGWIMKAWLAFVQGRDIRYFRVRSGRAGESIGAIKASIEASV